MKKIVLSLIILAMCLSVVVGCSDDNEGVGTGTTESTTTTTENTKVVIPPETVLHSDLYGVDLSNYVKLPDGFKYENLMISQKFIDQVVQEDIQKFLETYGTAVEYEDPDTLIQKGDIVELYYTGSAHDPSVELSESTLAAMTNSGAEKGMSVTIGSGTLIGAYENEENSDKNNPGFEDQLIGHKKGDKYVLTVTCPDNYSSTELQGVVVDFEVEIVSVSHIKETELTEELVTKNTSYKSVDEFLKESQEYFIKYHTYEGLKDVIKVTPHEDKNIDSNDMLIEYLFNDLGLVLTQGDYQTRLEAHYSDWYAYYLYYYGISSPEALETAMGKENLIILFQEDMIKEKLTEFVSVTE